MYRFWQRYIIYILGWKEPHCPLGMDNSHAQEGNLELRQNPLLPAQTYHTDLPIARDSGGVYNCTWDNYRGGGGVHGWVGKDNVSSI